MYRPADANYEHCSTAHVTGGLTVKLPPARIVFVMKLYRAHPQDHEDMVSLWPHCGFADPASAADAFRRAYPHGCRDQRTCGVHAPCNRLLRPWPWIDD
jgi:hypothetical protein